MLHLRKVPRREKRVPQKRVRRVTEDQQYDLFTEICKIPVFPVLFSDEEPKVSGSDFEGRHNSFSSDSQTLFHCGRRSAVFYLTCCWVVMANNYVCVLLIIQLVGHSEVYLCVCVCVCVYSEVCECVCMCICRHEGQGLGIKED